MLMEQYDVAKVTVRNSVAFLRDQGWVFTVSHRGTYVSQPEEWPAAAEAGIRDDPDEAS
jgi:DNA-binding GntR family transcriptional regulator